jgi:hypothetical protein
MIRKLFALLVVLSMIPMCGFTTVESEDAPRLPYRYASKEEGKALMLANRDYYDGFSQNELDYKMQKKNTTMEEYLAFAGEQVRDFTDGERDLVDGCFAGMQETLRENGFALPPLEEIVLIKTTMAEEQGAAGYTHGTQIYIYDEVLEGAVSEDEEERAFYQDFLDTFFWHELFHCLTRCNPGFRAEMYKLIRFTVVENDYPLPPGVFEYHISNPDVEHHNSYSSFHINGQDIDCFTDFVTVKHFEEPGESFFDVGTTALVPTDGSDTYYVPEQADNFDEVFGTNTGYVIDPEECMADNFSFAMCYGMDGPEGNGYPNPEIIEGILSYLRAD